MSSKKRPPSAGPVRVTAHPPERARRGAPVILPCGCCCCCCCCLHTIGGLVGGVAGSVLQIRPRPRPVDPDFPFPFRRDELDEEAPAFSPALLYWLLVSFLTAVTVVWYYLSSAASRGPLRGDATELLIGLLVAVMILPGLQLGASVLAVLAIAVFYGEKVTPLLRVGKITLWSVVGTLVGLFLMFGFCGVLYLGNK
jgi:ABC-type Fe3+ transport system permease subunit